MGQNTANQFVLFAHGETFDVDAYLKTTSLTFEKVWRRGQPKFPGSDQVHDTSSVQTILGDGRVISISQQERMACEFLKANSDALRGLAAWPGAGHRILGLQYHVELTPGVGGFCMGPPAGLMHALIGVGFQPIYYVTIDRVERPARPSRLPPAGGAG